jgi:excisionase family DNA binding protein
MSGEDVTRGRVTIREAATLLGVHTNTVRNRIKDGTLQAEKIVTKRGPTWMIDRNSLTNNTPPVGSQQIVVREAVLPLQELLPKIVNQLEEYRESAGTKDKRDRLAQSYLEFWKATYNLYRHIMTLSLAAIAALGAMLGSAFSDPTAWTGWTMFGISFVPRNVAMVCTFAGFLVAAVGSFACSTSAARVMKRIGEVPTAEELTEFQNEHDRRTSRISIEALISFLFFGIGIVGLEVFILGHIHLP